jgi:uncharacterized damage-inducible protein DinB
MTQRNEPLVVAFEQAAGRLLTVVESLSDKAWGATPAGEARTAGQIAYHMAEVYHNISIFIQMALNGQPLPALTPETLDGLNAEQAAHYASASRTDALEMLRQNGTAAAATLRTLSDGQLGIRTEFLGYPMTIESLVQNGLVGHTDEHLASIQSAAASV